MGDKGQVYKKSWDGEYDPAEGIFGPEEGEVKKGLLSGEPVPARDFLGEQRRARDGTPLYESDGGGGSGEAALVVLIAVVVIVVVIAIVLAVIAIVVAVIALIAWLLRGLMRSIRRDREAGTGVSPKTVAWGASSLGAVAAVAVVAMLAMQYHPPSPATSVQSGAAGTLPPGAPPPGEIWYGTWDWGSSTMASRTPTLAIGQTVTFVASLTSSPSQFQLVLRRNGQPILSPARQYVTVDHIASTLIEISIEGGYTAPGDFEIAIVDSDSQQQLAVGVLTVLPAAALAPAPTPGETEAATAAPKDATGRIAAFLGEADAAYRADDVDWLIAHLHPAVIEAHGEIACRGAIQAYEAPDFESRVVKISGPATWEYSADGKSTKLKSVFTVTIKRTANGSTTRKTIHLKRAGETMYWFSDCVPAEAQASQPPSAPSQGGAAFPPPFAAVAGAVEDYAAFAGWGFDGVKRIRAFVPSHDEDTVPTLVVCAKFGYAYPAGSTMRTGVMLFWMHPRSGTSWARSNIFIYDMRWKDSLAACAADVKHADEVALAK